MGTVIKLLGWRGSLTTKHSCRLPVDLHSNPHLWPTAMRPERMSIIDTSSWNEFPQECVWVLWAAWEMGVRSSDIGKETCSRAERSQLRWFGLIRIRLGPLLWEVLQAHPTGRRHRGKTKNLLEGLDLLQAGIISRYPEKLKYGAGERDVWNIRFSRNDPTLD